MKKKKRFESISAGNFTYIYVDIETGVNYLFVKHVEAGGLTPLLDKDGKPVITPIDKD